MAAAPIPNIWHLRHVAESSAKSCWICYKPSSSVLITPDSKDFFYICSGHLKDGGFCVPDAAEAAFLKEKSHAQALEQEKAQVVAEFEQRKKTRDKRSTDHKKPGEKPGEKPGDDASTARIGTDQVEDKKDAVANDQKSSAQGDEKADASSTPRIFNLSKVFYNQRLQRIRNAEAERANRERRKNAPPITFPSVPTANPGASGP